MGYSPWGCKELDRNEATEHTHTDMHSDMHVYGFFSLNLRNQNMSLILLLHTFYR